MSIVWKFVYIKDNNLPADEVYFVVYKHSSDQDILLFYYGIFENLD